MTIQAPSIEGKHLFKTRMSSCNYVFPNGKVAIFVNHNYMTDDEAEIEQLQREIKLGHKELHVDPNEVTVSAERANPIAALRRKIAEEEREKLMAELASGKDFGEYEPGKLKAASTTDIAPVTGGTPVGAAPSVAALKAKVTAAVTGSQE